MEIKVDTESATVTLDGRATYGAQELLALICKLGQCREQISAGAAAGGDVPPALAIDPTIKIGREDKHLTLAFDHPWFGRTGVALSDGSVLQLAAVLFQTANVISTSAGLVIGPELGKPYGTVN